MQDHMNYTSPLKIHSCILCGCMGVWNALRFNTDVGCENSGGGLQQPNWLDVLNKIRWSDEG